MRNCGRVYVVASNRARSVSKMALLSWILAAIFILFGWLFFHLRRFRGALETTGLPLVKPFLCFGSSPFLLNRVTFKSQKIFLKCCFLKWPQICFSKTKPKSICIFSHNRSQYQRQPDVYPASQLTPWAFSFCTRANQSGNKGCLCPS